MQSRSAALTPRLPVHVLADVIALAVGDGARVVGERARELDPLQRVSRDWRSAANLVRPPRPRVWPHPLRKPLAPSTAGATGSCLRLPAGKAPAVAGWKVSVQAHPSLRWRPRDLRLA